MLIFHSSGGQKFKIKFLSWWWSFLLTRECHLFLSSSSVLPSISFLSMLHPPLSLQKLTDPRVWPQICCVAENEPWTSDPVSTLRLPSSGITDVHHQIHFMECWDWTQGLVHTTLFLTMRPKVSVRQEVRVFLEAWADAQNWTGYIWTSCYLTKHNKINN